MKRCDHVLLRYVARHRHWTTVREMAGYLLERWAVCPHCADMLRRAEQLRSVEDYVVLQGEAETLYRRLTSQQAQLPLEGLEL